MSALSFLVLASGCHVFESIQVECTSDMSCAGGTDTADTADTAEDTDTGTPGEPEVGWVTAQAGAGKTFVRVIDPVSGEVARQWELNGEYPGTPFYDPASQSGLFAAIGGFWMLAADGDVASAGEGPDSENYDISHLGPDMLAAYQGGLTRVSADMSVNEQVVPLGTLTEIRYVGGNSRVAFFVDPSSGGPDLWKIDTSWEYGQVLTDYDTSLTRASNVFPGPDDKPYACSPVGSIYSVEAVSAGQTRAEAVYDGTLDDVSDCTWDPGDESFILYSPTAGLFRIDVDGRSEQVAEASTGFAYGRVAWYGN